MMPGSIMISINIDKSILASFTITTTTTTTTTTITTITLI